MNPVVIREQLSLIMPEALLGLAACAVYLGGTVRSNRHVWAGASLFGLLLAAFALGAQVAPHGMPAWLKPGQVYNGPIYPDAFAQYIRLITIVSGVVLVLFGWNSVPDRQAADYYGSLLFLLAGVGITGAANDLVTLFLGLELISIPTYILLYLPKADLPAQEASVKYFMLSVFSSALLLFGLSYMYGLTGTTYLPDVIHALKTGLLAPPKSLPVSPGMVQVALIMVVAGLGFRLTAVPFHFYAPDVYQGTPLVNAAMLALIPKVAGFAALFRLFGFVLEDTAQNGVAQVAALGVPRLFWILAAVTMTMGNVLALLQSNLKRLLAYSSVAHAGYMLIGVTIAHVSTEVSSTNGVTAVLFYLVAYGAMTVGAFAVVSYLSTPARPVETVEDLAGLGHSHPGLALTMGLFLFSLIGMPLTAGFWGKLLLFLGVFEVPANDPSRILFYWLAFIGVVNAAIGAWYYLSIIAAMYLRSPIKPLEVKPAWPAVGAIAICALITLGVGVYPLPLRNLAAIAAARTETTSAGAQGERLAATDR